MDEQNKLTAAQLHGKAKLPWKLSPSRETELDNGKGILELKHGMSATVPIMCRGMNCPYVKTCIIDPSERSVGEHCLMEIAAITSRFDQYCKALGIGDNDMVDLSLVREIVDIEVQVLRADALLAKDANFIEYVVAGVSEDGTPFYKPELHKAFEAKNALRKERHRILQLLNSTRKDREQGKINDPSTQAANIIARMKELEKQGALKPVASEPKADDNKQE